MSRAAIRAPGAAIAAIFLAAALLGATAPVVRGFATNIDDEAIARAIAIGRSSDAAERQRFHDGYLIRLNDSLVDRLEIVTEFRRVVLETETRRGARDADWGPRQAAEMLRRWRDKVTLRLHVTFPPNNSYYRMPRIDLALYGRPQAPAAARRIEPLDRLETPQYVWPQPAPPGTPILGAIVDAIFGVRTLDSRAVYLAGISLEGRELRRVEVDFGRVE